MLGVLGPRELEDADVEEGGRVAARATESFAAFVMRGGEALLDDGACLDSLFGVELAFGEAEVLTVFERFALKAARCGSGLIGRVAFSACMRALSDSEGSCLGSASSSEVLSLLRVPVLSGEPEGLELSRMIDFGRYLGSPDAVAGRGRRDGGFIEPSAEGLAPSREARGAFICVDILRLAVIVFWSGVFIFFAGGEAFCSTLAASRKALSLAGANIALDRCESFCSRLAFLSSLCIASENALPTEEKFKEWRIDERPPILDLILLVSDIFVVDEQGVCAVGGLVQLGNRRRFESKNNHNNQIPLPHREVPSDRGLFV